MNSERAIDVRIATDDDALCISALAIHVFLDTYATEGITDELAREVLCGYSEEVFRSLITSPNNVSIYVAHINAHVVGFIEMKRDTRPPGTGIDKGMEVSRLYVQPNFHGKRIGTTLLKVAEKQTRLHELPLIWLTAWSGNHHAIGFYKHCSFVDVGGVEHEIEGQIYENRLLTKYLKY